MTRGQLRIYLGAAPGVGKTFAMLNEGRRRAERGTDVVVGIVETHGRAEDRRAARRPRGRPAPDARRTAAPRFEELDVDAVLARRPQVALGRRAGPHQRHRQPATTKRWQDIDELLDAGIDVISTVNVQHLESLNDVVERITGITQQETVPDAWVRAAEQIELVDMTPEALRRRMAHGNIYPAERIDAALGQLVPRRQPRRPARAGPALARRPGRRRARTTTGSATASSGRGRRASGSSSPSPARPAATSSSVGPPAWRCGPRPSSSPSTSAATTASERRRRELLDRHRELVEELGGRYLEASGTDVARALLDVARAENATQIVLGATRRSSPGRDLSAARSSTGSSAGSGAIDVHVVTTAADDAELVLPRPARWDDAAAAPAAPDRAGASPSLAPPLATAALVPSRDDLQLGLGAPALPRASPSWPPPSAGVGPGLVAAVSGFLLVNWFFTHPIHTFTIRDAENVLALVVFLAVAATVSAYVALAARRAADATRAHAEAATLARLAAGDDADPERLAPPRRPPPRGVRGSGGRRRRPRTGRRPLDDAGRLR